MIRAVWVIINNVAAFVFKRKHVTIHHNYLLFNQYGSSNSDDVAAH
jgi:hypothetical protein